MLQSHSNRCLLLLALWIVSNGLISSAQAHVVPSWAEPQLRQLERAAASPHAPLAQSSAQPSSLALSAGQPVALTWVRAVPVLLDVNGARMQVIQFNVSNFGGSRNAVVSVLGGAPQLRIIPFGKQRVDLLIPAVDGPTMVDVVLAVSGQRAFLETVEATVVRPWEVYLLSHSHVDLGFTHTQDEVEQQNWVFYEESIALARATAGYPAGSAFKWNVQILWAVESYLAQASPEKVAEFVEAVENGWIGLDALFANMLTGLQSREELVHTLDAARSLREKYGLPIDSAMITDLPGYSWGLVPVLADSGIRYWSIGANFIRSGNFHRSWDDRPFYWVGPDGESEVLTWSSGQGYTAFVLTFLRDGDKIVDHLHDLEQADYPYDLTYLRYVIFDNAGPDLAVADVVRDWNDTHLAPKLILATTPEPFEALEARYGDILPRVSGDFTGYWEDGAASSALETGMNRQSAQRLVQAEKLWSMLNPTAYSAEDFGLAWRQALLFDEHTWGSFFSIIDPSSPLDQAIWATKRGYATAAESMSRFLLTDAAAEVAATSDVVETVRVFNTSSWDRTELVELPTGWSRVGDQVRDAGGELVPSQVLSTGALAFLASAVPGFGSATFHLHAAPATAPGGTAEASGTRLSNGTTQVDLDPATGAIASLRHRRIPVDLVQPGEESGLNDYRYVDGRDPALPDGVEVVTISVEEPGPLVASLRIESSAPGAASLTRVVRLVSGLGHVDISNVLDKTAIFDPEAVHVAFPFHVPEGVVRLDLPWSMIEPDLDQIDGANKNHFTTQDWLDISNDDYGVTWTALDAPLVELGQLNADAEVVGYVEQVGATTAVYSLAMNNYWFTNFRASQEGATPLRYAILPHGQFDPAAATRFGEARRQPLVVLPVEGGSSSGPLLAVTPEDVHVSTMKPSADGEGWVLRLFGVSGENREARIVGLTSGPLRLNASDLQEERGEDLDGVIHVPAYGMVTVLARRLPADAVELPRGGRIRGCLDPHDEAWFRFDVASPPARASLRIRGWKRAGSGKLQASVSLLSPDGVLESIGGASEPGGTIRVKRIPLVTAGGYALRIGDAGGAGGCFVGRVRIARRGSRHPKAASAFLSRLREWPGGR